MDSAPTHGRALSPLTLCRTGADRFPWIRPKIRPVEAKRNVDPARIPPSLALGNPDHAFIVRGLEQIERSIPGGRDGMLVQFLRAGVHDAERVVREAEGVRADPLAECVGGGGRWERWIRDGTKAEFARGAEGKGNDGGTWSEVCANKSQQNLIRQSRKRLCLDVQVN